jgi:signal transduction histidine kinase/DNA-binding response OmpR family regulator
MTVTQLQKLAGAAATRPTHDDERASILVVDDLPEKLLVFETALEELDQHLVFVRSGKGALREILQREFAVILLDVNMPDIDGFETAALIRQHKRSAHTPIIFITSYADEMQTSRGYALGAVDYILSPVVPEVLRSKVQVFVRLFAMQRQIRRQADAHAAFMAAEAARRAAEDNDRRSALLSDASRVLNRSLQADESMRELAGLMVQAWASLAVVARSDDDQPADEVVVAAQPDTGRRTRCTTLPRANLGEPVRAVLEAALRERCRHDLSPADLLRLDASSFGDASQPLAGPRFDAAAAVPLVNGDRLLGAVFVASQASDERSAAIGWSVLDDLAARAAAAFENARLYGSLQAEIVERRAIEAQLIESGRRKDEFLAMLSHELRNPLAPIRTALEVIRRIAPPDPKFTWASDIMVRQLRQMTRLIEELLDVARISQGKIVLTREKVDLNAVISQSVETVQPFVDARDQTMEVALLREPMWLQGDFARLAQIVSNLLHNASKYSEKGTLIAMRAEATEGGALIRVRDQGIGIDAELLPRVFDLFTQGRRGLDRAQGGLGIGLTLARRLAEMHGGRIEAFSEGVGKGSEFTLRLPCIGVVRPVDPAPSSARRQRSMAHRVLVVDDNRDAAQSIASFMQIEGHEVRMAGDGMQALEAAASFAPDVVVLDIGLPLLDGYEVARRLREIPATRHALVLALTGYGQQEDRLIAHGAGFDRHFVKPADPTELLASIDAWEREGGTAALGDASA